MGFARVTADSRQLGGVPCIRRLRIPLATVGGMVAEGMTTTEILEAYPDLVEDDVREALRFAVAAVRERDLYPPNEPPAFAASFGEASPPSTMNAISPLA